MWQVWQVGAADVLGEDLVLLEQLAHAVLGGGVHLPLGMVEPHVAGLAGLRLPRLLDREGVPGVAGVARGHPEPGPVLLQLSRSPSSVFSPILWQPPQPFIPSVMAMG